MTIALLHINDHSMGLTTENGETRLETGFIRVDDRGLVTGWTAYETAWTDPHLSNNRFWQELNQRPLPRKLRYARHHADMAYAQLRKMLSGIPNPKILLSVPRSLDNDQLALLIGLVQAIPAELCGIVDGALLAARFGHKLVVEIQLHQAVLTELETMDGNITVRDHQKIPKLGITAIYRELAAHVSEKLISSNRYDPLHSPASQQKLYNAIPSALAEILTHLETTISLDTPGGLLSIKLCHSDLTEILDPLFKELNQHIDRHPPTGILLGTGSEILATFKPNLKNADRIDYESLAERGFNLVRSGEISAEPLTRILSLKSVYCPEDEVGPVASHLVYEGRAWRVDEPLSLKLTDTGIAITRGESPNSDLIIHATGDRLAILHRNDEAAMVVPGDALCGEWLMIGDYKLQLIEIHDA